MIYDPLNVKPANGEETSGLVMPKSQEELETRAMSDSFDQALIPLSSDLALRDRSVYMVSLSPLFCLSEE